jgi:hypothetical protein
MNNPVLRYDDIDGVAHDCKLDMSQKNPFSLTSELKSDRMYSPLISTARNSRFMTSYNPLTKTVNCDQKCMSSANNLAQTKRTFYSNYHLSRPSSCIEACRDITYMGVLADDSVGAAIRSYIPKHCTFSSSVSMSGGLEYTSTVAGRHLNRFICDIGDAIIVDVFRMVHNCEDKIQLVSLNRVLYPLQEGDAISTKSSAENVHDWLQHEENRKIFVGFAKCSNQATDFSVTVQHRDVSVFRY